MWVESENRLQNLFGAPDERVFQGYANDNVELFKAWAGTTVAYALTSVGGNLARALTAQFAETLLISAVVCGLGFVLHELAHRVVARRYGAQAHFVANNQMLVVSLLIALAGLFLAAPGAVWYRGMLTKAQNGKIALAGPVANFALSIIFFIGLIVMYVGMHNGNPPAPGWLQEICLVGFSLNAWLGLFNMIPAGPFDGAKVLAWSPVVFGVAVVVGVFLAFGLQNQTVLDFLFSLLAPVLGARG